MWWFVLIPHSKKVLADWVESARSLCVSPAIDCPDVSNDSWDKPQPPRDSPEDKWLEKMNEC